MNLATWLLDVRLKDDSRDPTTLFTLKRINPPKGSARA